MATSKVLPSEVLYKQFEEELSEGRLSLEGIVKLGARFML